VRLLARNVRGDVTGLSDQMPRASTNNESTAMPLVGENRLPTPLSLASTEDGLALTAIARPVIEPVVTESEHEEGPRVAVRSRAVLHVMPPLAPPRPLKRPPQPKPPAPDEPAEMHVVPEREEKARTRKRERLVAAPGAVARPGEPQIEFRDVSVTFGSINALRGITFTINTGELVFLVGESGAGKTTTFRLISGQMRPGKGEVWVDRVPVHKARRHGVAVLRRRIGFVGEDYSMLANRTALENVEFALRMSDLSLPGSEVKRRALAELRNVALLARASALPGQLSTGQRQRLALARALVTRPLVLLADEPTAGLDARNATRVMRLLQRAAAHQTAVLVATHDRPMAASVRARILVLDKGRLSGDYPSWVDLCRAE
jgi:cell division transport system ATP-binding protein